MEDSILKDLEIYYAIEILKGNIKIEYNKEDNKILGEYYEGYIRNINRNDNKRLYKRKRRRWLNENNRFIK